MFQAQVIATILLPLVAAFNLMQSSALETNSGHLLTFFIVVPIISAFAIMASPRKWIRWISLFAASFELGIALKVFTLYQIAAGGFQIREEVPWLSNFGIGYLLGVDGMSTLMVLLVACVYFAGTLISWNVAMRTKEYFVLFSLLVGGVAGAYESLDLFFFFLFYEFAVLPMYLLVGIWGSGRKEYAAMKLTLMLLAGSAFMLVGFIAMYFTSGVHTFDIRILGDLAKTGFSGDFQNIWFP